MNNDDTIIIFNKYFSHFVNRSTFTPDLDGIDNPPNMRGVRSSVILAILLIVLSLFLAYITIPLVSISIGALVAITILYIEIESQFISRPKKVKVGDDGLILYMRFWQGIKSVRYDQIKWIDVADSNPSLTLERSCPDGFIGLGPRNREIHPMIWPIAIQVRDAYKNKMGRLPSKKNHGWEMESKMIPFPFYGQARMRASTKIVFTFFTIISGILVLLGLYAYGSDILEMLLFVVGANFSTAIMILYIDHYQFPKALDFDSRGITLHRWLLGDVHIEQGRIADIFVARKFASIYTIEPRRVYKLSKEMGQMVLAIAKERGIIN